MFLKVRPLNLKETPSQLSGAPPKREVTEESEVLINFDFVTMVSFPEPKPGVTLPDDCSVIVLHTGETLLAKGKASDFLQRLKK